MVNKKIFQFSCNYMSGFKVEVDLDDCSNIDDIVNYSKIFLKSFLESNNLFTIEEKTSKINYHIHDYTFDQLQNLQFNDTEKLHGFICGHEE